MSNVTLYGLKDCTTCNAARRELAAAGRSVRFVSLDGPAGAGVTEQRARPRAEDLVNKRNAVSGFASTGQALDHPVIEAGGKTYVGWNAAVKAGLGL